MVTRKKRSGVPCLHAREPSRGCGFQTGNGVESLADTVASDRLAAVRTCARRFTPGPIDRNVALGPPLGGQATGLECRPGRDQEFSGSVAPRRLAYPVWP